MVLSPPKRPETGHSTVRIMLLVFSAFCLFLTAANAENDVLSENFSLHIDPAAREILGETAYGGIAAFFNKAERAIETENLESLMALYSGRYTDGTHNKKTAAEVWKRIFSTFDTMATHHDMKLVGVAGKRNVVILRCSGLLLGVPDFQENAITIDAWDQQDHVLANEDGAWVLLGTYGKEKQRPGADKPMHPLF
ncbi:MAG: hypothetical protein QF609_06235 [Gammaproteobacteria bacterium]|nr:hypothetical protein [Gammaproteobacteria bacterium]